MADTPDTTGFVTTELFDYNELINTNFMHAATVTVNSPNPWPPGNPNTHSETWTAKGDFQFITWNYYRNTQNSIGMPAHGTDYSN